MRKKIGISNIICLLLVLLSVYLSFNYIFLKSSIESYNRGAYFSSIEVERSLEEFEKLIVKESGNFTYYNDTASAFLPSFSLHLITSDKFVNKYDEFFMESYYPLGDELRNSIGAFKTVNDESSYQEALEEFNQTLDRYKKAVKKLEKIDK